MQLPILPNKKPEPVNHQSPVGAKIQLTKPFAGIFPVKMQQALIS